MRKSKIIENQKKQIGIMIDEITDLKNEVEDLKGQIKIKEDLIQKLINALMGESEIIKYKRK